MKIAVLSDIHGNLPALRSVIADVDAWSPDLVVSSAATSSTAGHAPASVST
jgi:hypothetical protein